MANLIVPSYDPMEPWPTLGPQVCALIEERMVFGPGSLNGLPAKLDNDKRAAIYSFYEVYPKGHEYAGRRRFKRCGYSVRKGRAKTELLAWVSLAELHPDGPVRCDGFDASGSPVGRPVVDPYIPLMAVSIEQVEELAYGALKFMVEEGPDSDLFFATDAQIVRLGASGRAAGKAVAVANNPGARDGARTTFQGFDEPHRLYLPRQVAAHETMVANLSKREMEDPWGLYVGTAGELGQGSVAEGLHAEAEMIERGEIDDPQLFYFHREAEGTYDMTNVEERTEAIREATGPDGEWVPGEFRNAAKQWDRPKADRSYLERVYLNRWVRAEAQAFDPNLFNDLILPKGEDPFVKGAFITAGFDGARFKDSTGIVLTHIPTGAQKLWAGWERQSYEIDPATGEVEEWEIDEDEVTQSVKSMLSFFDVWRFNCDPPHWYEPVAAWAQLDDCVEEFITQHKYPMARAVRAYREGMQEGAISYVRDERVFTQTSTNTEETYVEALARHQAAAGRHDLSMEDDDGVKLYLLKKLHPTRKFDFQMAAVLSWEARLAALRKQAKPTPRRGRVVKRLR